MRKVRYQIAAPGNADAALGKLEIGWLFLPFPTLLRHSLRCSMVTQAPPMTH